MRKTLEIIRKGFGSYEVLVEDCVETKRIDGRWFVIGTREDGSKAVAGPFDGESDAESFLVRVHAAQIDAYRRTAAELVEEHAKRGGRFDA